MNFSFQLPWKTSSESELPDIFPFPIDEKDFIATDVVNIYAKILTDVIERTQGISEEYNLSLWDNCLQSEHSDGLVTLLAKAMADKKDLFLVYDKAVKLLRKATSQEEQTIKADYQKAAGSTVGTYISFKQYKRTDMVKLYSGIEYSAIASLGKNMNLSKAIQIKMSDMRASTGMIDKAEVEAQAVAIAKGLKQGKDILIDAKDIIETAKPDLSATDKAMVFINQRRSFYLGLPASYVTGEAPAGLGDSGQGESRAIERGLKNYYFSVIKPVIESVFPGVKTTFKSEDSEQLTTALAALKDFELTSDELLSAENKLKIINKLFGLDEKTKGGAPADRPPAVPPTE